MHRKQKFAKPFDLAHGILFNDFPEVYTKIIGVPGNFVKKINRRVHLKDGTGGEMDSAYIAEPDYEILFERVAVDLEHQSVPVGDVKLTKFGDYDIQLVCDENLPTLLAVASHLNDGGSKKELIRSPSDITKLYFLDLGEENIYERLSTVSKIINNNEYLNVENALNLGVIVLYAPRELACEITEIVVNLYLKIVNDLDLKMECCLYSVITIMIDAYFDDENEYGRLTKMIDEKTSGESRQLFASHENTMESLKYAREDLARTNEDLAKANSDLARTNEDLARTNEDLAVANDRIADLEAEVKRLTDKLNGK